MTSWVLLPPWGVRAVAAAAGILIALAILRVAAERRQAGLRRQAPALLLRLLVLAGLLLVALNPTALLQRSNPGIPRLLILLDTSASMSYRDEGGRGRLEAALGVLQDSPAVQALEASFLMEARAFDAQAKSVDLHRVEPAMAAGKASDIRTALVEAVRGLQERPGPAAILLVSDGRATAEDTLDAARLALAASIPVYGWCLGGPVPRKDVGLQIPSPETLAFSGSDAILTAELSQSGYPRQSFRVELLREDQVLDACEAQPAEGAAAVVRFRVHEPQPGEHRYRFRAPAQPGEADLLNNERAAFLQVLDEKVRVLLAEGQPHWDTKFLVQALRNDPHVDLTAVYRLGPDKFFGLVSAGGQQRREEADLFPRSDEALMAYDVVLFGRGCESFFDSATEARLTKFVAERGGGIVFARGKAYNGRFLPLARFEPVSWGPGADPEIRPHLTPEGLESPIFEIGPTSDVQALIGRLPALDQAAWTLGERPLAVVLATAGGATSQADSGRTILLAYQRYGQGKVLTLNATGLWRWCLRPRAAEDEETAYARLWNAILRWMIAGNVFDPGAQVSLRSARRHYTDEQTLQFFIHTQGIDRGVYRPRLSIRPTPGLETRPGPDPSPAVASPMEIEPREQKGGGYSAEAGPLPPGSYQVTLFNNAGRPETLFLTVEVLSASVENRELSADPDLLRKTAESSGGKMLRASEISSLPEIFKQWQASGQQAYEKQTVWDRWWMLGGMLLALGIEWFLRRREGLI
ncbi:MAG: VWA domain-containing protein [Planctomycetes bacterium]|nr:VWA domain-containing protein [Planctomycetota bacterium]